MITYKKTALFLVAGLVLVGAGAGAVSAATTADVTDTVSTTDNNKLSDLQKALRSGDAGQVMHVADFMIDSRIATLNELKTNIASFAHVSSSDKDALTAQVQTNLTAMNNLRAKIDAEAGITTTSSSTISSTLRDDATSITKSYRIGILIQPQVKRVLVADKIESIAVVFGNLESAFQTQINTHVWVNAGDKQRAQNALDDMKQQVTNANGAAVKAEAEVAGLVPDKGDKTVLDANNAALAAAKTELQGAVDDLHTARTDVDTIQSILGGKTTTR